MRLKSTLFAALLLAATAEGKDLKAYQDARLQQMDSVPCAPRQKKEKKPQLCHEYTLETDQVQYRIRQTNEKHPVLLPVGEPVQFRLEKTQLLLRLPAQDNKERQFEIISVKPRGENSAEATPHINHLQ
jgi:hypothetical protein